MITLLDRPTAYFDVDDTLVMWDHPSADDNENIVTIENKSDGLRRFKFHAEHVEVIKKYKIRGHNVVVWSQGGSDWAVNVVRALGLEKYVDVVAPKPSWYYDDLPASSILEPYRQKYVEREKYLGRSRQ